MRMRRHYTKEEIQFVKKNIQGRPYAEMTKLFNEHSGLCITLKQMENLLYKHRLRNGIGSFMPGHVPANKSKKSIPSPKRSPVGTERTHQGYIEIKTADPSVWEKKHSAAWKAANGKRKVPKGHAVIFADGNKKNFSPDNLMLVSRGELAVMNNLGLICSRKDLTAAGKTIADLKMAIGRRKKTKKRRPVTCKTKNHAWQ